jgi:hypothetical protein
MGRWVLVAAIFAPVVTHAGPTPDAPPSNPTPTAYAAQPPAAHGHLSPGWGLYATLQGRSMDLQSRDWADDPHAQPRDIEAGYGWRSGRTEALIGYNQHDFGPKRQQQIAPGSRDPNDPQPVSSSGVLGFSFVLHGR